MNRALFIQARMGSTRLPGKVLLPLRGKTIIRNVVERLYPVQNVTEKAVLIPKGSLDDPLLECITTTCPGVSVFRGSEEDVLARFYEAACAFHSDVIVRITADCPCIEPKIVDAVIDLFLKTPDCSYASNTLQRGFPRGFDVEVFSFQALSYAYHHAQDPAEREHVTLYIYRHPELFHLVSLLSPVDLSSLRLTVDELDDLKTIENVYEALGPNPLTFETIIELQKTNPTLFQQNSHVCQKNVFISQEARELLQKVPSEIFLK